MAVLFLANPMAATAQVALLFDDGGTHDVDYQTDDIELRNATTANLLPGADAVGGPFDYSFVASGNSTLNLMGGSIGGQRFLPSGVNQGVGATGIGASSSTVNIISGTVEGGNNTFQGNAMGLGPGIGIEVDTNSVVTILGGSVRGGDQGGLGISTRESRIVISGGEVRGGNAADFNTGAVSAVRSDLFIQSGVVSGGDAASAPAAFSAVDVVQASGGGTVSISGGIVKSGDVPFGASADTFGEVIDVISADFLEITGGEVIGSAKALFVEDTPFSITGGTIRGGVAGNRATTMTIFATSGEISGGRFSASADSITPFHGDLFQADRATLSVRGGEFDPNARWDINSRSVFTVYGYGLELVGPFIDRVGRIVGTLSDGTPINVPYELDADSQLLLVEVPEPAAVGLFLIGVAGTTFCRRRARTLKTTSPRA